MLLPCAYPFPIDDNKLEHLNCFMNSFWKYNEFTAKGKKSVAAITEINKIIRNNLFNQSMTIDFQKLNEVPSGLNESNNRCIWDASDRLQMTSSRAL